MSLHCPKCQKPFDVSTRASRPRVAAVPSIRREEQGDELSFSWWQHGGAHDMRLLGLLGLAIPLGLAHKALPGIGLIAYLQGLANFSGGLADFDWYTLNCLTVALLATALYLALVLPYFWSRQFLRWDGQTLRAWSSTFREHRVREVPGPEVEQLYVTPHGDLRCIRQGVRGHLVMATGPLEGLRYMEQQLEEKMHVVDLPVEGEWTSQPLAARIRSCPHCGFQLPQAEVARQIAPEVAPARLIRALEEGKLVLSWPWRGWELGFLAFWLTLWGLFSAVLASLAWSLAEQGVHPGVFVIPHVWVGVFLVYCFLCCLLNWTHVRCDRSKIQIETAPLPWPAFRQEIDCAQVEQIYVVHSHGHSPYFRLEARTRDGRHVVLLKHQTDGHLARYVEQELEQFLNITNEDVPEEWVAS